MSSFVTGKLLSYLALAAAGLTLAVIAGDPDLAALALPFAALVAYGGFITRPARVELSIGLDRGRALVGETVEAELALGADAPLTAELRLPPGRGLAPEEPERLRTIRLRAGRPERLQLPIRCRRWGRYDLGQITVRATDRFGLYVHAGRPAASRELRVYPRPEALRAPPLPPRQTQALIGDFVSRTKADGLEFADVREYRAGDTSRHINWPLTARRGSLHVNEYHSEHNADVVFFLDTYADIENRERSTLDRTVRAAGTLADLHLRRRDRVGVVWYGGNLHWLTPATGLHQHYRIVEALLETSVHDTPAERDVAVLSRSTLPTRALVLALSPLADQRAITALLGLARRGLDIVVIEVREPRVVDTPLDAAGRLALRIEQLQHQSIRALCQSEGAPVVQWDGDAPLAMAIEQAREWRRRPCQAHA